MVTLSHTNFALHRFLTDEGAFIHTHFPDSFEDVGDAESGPELTGGPAWDQYAGDSHILVVDESGLIVHSELIDWGWCNWVDDMIVEHGDDGSDWPDYIKPRKTGEDWQVSLRDEDGRWWRHSKGCWVDSRAEAGFFSFAHAAQIAAKVSQSRDDDWNRSSAKVVHADECPRCLVRKQPDSKRLCGLCGQPLAKLGAPV